MTPGLKVVVAPLAGRVHLLPPRAFARGREVVHAGQPLALVEGGSRTATVVAPVEGVVDGLLVHEGEPVVAGQPVVAVRS